MHLSFETAGRRTATCTADEQKAAPAENMTYRSHLAPGLSLLRRHLALAEAQALHAAPHLATAFDLSIETWYEPDFLAVVASDIGDKNAVDYGKEVITFRESEARLAPSFTPGSKMINPAPSDYTQ